MIHIIICPTGPTKLQKDVSASVQYNHLNTELSANHSTRTCFLSAISKVAQSYYWHNGSKERWTLFYLTTSIHSSLRPFHTMAANAELAIPVCHESGSTCFLVQCHALNIPFSLIIYKEGVGMFSFSSRMHFTSDRHSACPSSFISYASQKNVTSYICQIK